VDDVVQESMWALCRALPGFRGESTVSHFAARITIRTAVVARRRALARTGPLLPLEDGASHADSALPPDEAVASARRGQALTDALATIPAAQAETLAMRVVLGHSLEEIAEITGSPINTVRSRLRLAKEALARRIALDPVLVDLLEVER